MSEETPIIGEFQCVRCGDWFALFYDAVQHATKCRTTKVWLGSVKSLQTKEFSGG